MTPPRRNAWRGAKREESMLIRTGAAAPGIVSAEQRTRSVGNVRLVFLCCRGNSVWHLNILFQHRLRTGLRFLPPYP